MSTIIEQVVGLYRVVQLNPFRKTPGVTFDMLPLKLIENIGSIDRVLHDSAAQSPNPIADVVTPWYMHTHQDDNLIVLSGSSTVYLYKESHATVEEFEIKPNAVYRNGKLIYEGGAMLVIPRFTFHRIVSGRNGSASINIAHHYHGFNLDTNFNIYDLDTFTGVHKVLRRGLEDQRF